MHFSRLPLVSVMFWASWANAAKVPDIKEWKLENGLDVVYLGVVRRAPVVTVQVWYHVGSKDEPRDRRGSAHMFEHMMFKGTKHVPPEEHARFVNQVGGEVNAFTTEDMTGYHNTVPKERFEFAMQLEAERMRGLLFRPEMVNTEREVVKEEIRMRIDNNPILSAISRLRALAFTTHPYAWTAAGDKADLDNTSAQDLKAFYDKYYVPNNATLIIVGDVSEHDVRSAAQKWFGPIPAGLDPLRESVLEPTQEAERREIQKPSQFGLVGGGYKMPAARSNDMYALKILASILSDGESSRLNQRAVRKDKVAVAVGTFVQELEEPGLFMLYGLFLTANQADQVEAAMKDEIARVRSEPVTARELEKARNQLATQFAFSLENAEDLAAQIGESKLKKGSARAWVDGYEKYLAVTADDVMRVAREYLVPEHFTLVVIPPAGGGK